MWLKDIFKNAYAQNYSLSWILQKHTLDFCKCLSKPVWFWLSKSKKKFLTKPPIVRIAGCNRRRAQGLIDRPSVIDTISLFYRLIQSVDFKIQLFIRLFRRSLQVSILEYTILFFDLKVQLLYRPVVSVHFRSIGSPMAYIVLSNVVLLKNLWDVADYNNDDKKMFLSSSNLVIFLPSYLWNNDNR
jgi:hypothetical protein